MRPLLNLSLSIFACDEFRNLCCFSFLKDYGLCDVTNRITDSWKIVTLLFRVLICVRVFILESKCYRLEYLDSINDLCIKYRDSFY